MIITSSIEATFNKLGLTSQETRVYLTLLELKEAKSGLLCTKTNIASSNIYRILESLIQHGLVSCRIQNNIKIFVASSPDVLNDLFIEKLKTFEEERKSIADFVSSLKTQNPTTEPYSNYRYFEGLVGIKALWHEINGTMNKSITIRAYTAKRESYERLISSYDEHHRIRRIKKVNELMIFPEKDRKRVQKRGDKLTRLKFMVLENDAEWGVVGEMVYIQQITENIPRGFLIKDRVFAKTFEQVFDQLWDVAIT